MTVEHRYLLAPAVNPGAFVAELDPTAVEWSEQLNGPGEATISVPLRQRGGDIDIINSASTEVAKTILWVEANGQLVWGGLVLTAGVGFEAGTVTFNAVGWHEYLKRRRVNHLIVVGGQLVREPLIYTQQDQVSIVADIIARANAAEGAPQLFSVAPVSTGILRDWRIEPYELQYIGELLESMSALNNGFDFRYVSRYSTSGEPEVVIDIQYPATGRETDFVIESGGFADLLSYDIDGSAIYNDVAVTGEGFGDAQLYSEIREPQIGNVGIYSYPLLQYSEAYSDETDQATLDARAARVLTRGGTPIKSAAVRLVEGGSIGLYSLRVGDLVDVRGTWDYLTVDERMRIVSATHARGDGGSSVTYQLASAEAFTQL